MSVGGPDLGAVDEEVVALVDRAGLDGGEIGTVVGLRETLAPDLLGRRNFWDEALFLRRRSPLHQRGTYPRDTLEVDRWRCFGAIELLIVDHLLQQRRAAAAVFLRPMDAHPAAVVELAMPPTAALEFRLGIRVGEFVLVAPVARSILLKPAPELQAKQFVGFTELEIHRAIFLCFATSASRGDRERPTSTVYAQPAKRGSGLPFTPSPLIANRLPPSAPGSILRIFSPIEVAYITSRLSPPNITLVIIGTGT